MPSVTRRKSGSAMADFPAALWLLVLGLLLPILCLATMSFRAIFFYMAVRDCCYQAAKEESFSDANSKAAAVFTKDIDAWNGLKITANPNVVVVIRDTAGSTTKEVAGPLKAPDAPVDTKANVYMLKVYCDGDIQPLIPTGNYSGFFCNIPGLTGPYPMQMSYQVYTENPNGLGS
jgi:hypothetical protein